MKILIKYCNIILLNLTFIQSVKNKFADFLMRFECKTTSKSTPVADYDKILTIFDQCTEAKFLPLGIYLEDTFIDADAVVEYILKNSVLKLDHTEFCLLDSGGCFDISIESAPIFCWHKDEEEIMTLEELADELSSGWSGRIEIPNENFYDWIVASCSPQEWYCENNSIRFARLNLEEFITYIEKEYGISIAPSTVSNSTTTVRTICELIVENINSLCRIMTS